MGVDADLCANVSTSGAGIHNFLKYSWKIICSHLYFLGCCREAMICSLCRCICCLWLSPSYTQTKWKIQYENSVSKKQTLQNQVFNLLPLLFLISRSTKLFRSLLLPHCILTLICASVRWKITHYIQGINHVWCVWVCASSLLFPVHVHHMNNDLCLSHKHTV